YAVDDLAVPPHPSWLRNWAGGAKPRFGSHGLQTFHQQNSLLAFDLTTGRLVWELPGKPKERRADLEGSHFLGAPLPVGDQLYVRTEKARQARLVCIAQAPPPHPGRPDRVIVTPQVAWTLKLAEVRDPVTRDLNRRVHAVPLAHDGGILVCPTHAGTVLGVDVVARTVLWACPYRDNEDAPPAVDYPPQRLPSYA